LETRADCAMARLGKAGEMAEWIEAPAAAALNAKMSALVALPWQL